MLALIDHKLERIARDLVVDQQIGAKAKRNSQQRTDAAHPITLAVQQIGDEFEKERHEQHQPQ